MAGFHLLRCHILFADLPLWPRFEGPALALDDSRHRIWSARVVSGLAWISHVPAFLESLQRHLRIIGGSHDSIALALFSGLAYLLGGTINAEIQRVAMRVL